MIFSLVSGMTTPSGQVAGAARQFNADGALELDVPVPVSTNNLPVVMALDVSQLKAFIIMCDQALVVEFNDSTTGVPTINLVANHPYIWTVDDYVASLLTVDITTVFLTNVHATLIANFKLRALYDPTV